MNGLWLINLSSIILISILSSTAGVMADCNKSSFGIAIDIGHTNLKPGAISARGVPEFIYNTELAQIIEKTTGTWFC